MKRTFVSVLAVLISLQAIFAKGGSETSAADWPQKEITIICPWAVGGVADLINRKMATYGEKYLGVPVLATNELGAGGNVALTNYLKNEPNSYNLILGSEGGFAIAPNVEGAEAIRFKYEDFEPIINLYSAIFVMTADSKTGIKNLDDLKAYGQGKNLKIAVNGIAGDEAFLAKSLAKELGLQIILVSYNGANLALDAAAKGETQFAISHQSQARSAVEAKKLTAICGFNKNGIHNDVYDVQGVGDYGIQAYYANECGLFARKGTDPRIIAKVHDAYLKILNEPEVKDLYKTLMVIANPIEKTEYDKYIESVKNIVLMNR